MGDTETTRVSSKGQVVIPQGVRELTGLREGDTLAVYGEGDTIVLRKVAMPSQEEMKRLYAWGERFAKRKGITRRDVAKAVREVRAERR
jgi:AbrB family looped-hinge helix DNA binding protein